MKKINTINLRNQNEIVSANIDLFLSMNFEDIQSKNFFQYMIHNISFNYFEQRESLTFNCIDFKLLEKNESLKNDIKQKLKDTLDILNKEPLNTSFVKENSILIQQSIQMYDMQLKNNIQINNSNIDTLKKSNIDNLIESFKNTIMSFDNSYPVSEMEIKLIECIEELDIYKQDFIDTLKKEKKYFINDNMQENFRVLEYFIKKLDEHKDIIIKDIKTLPYTYSNFDFIENLSSSFKNYGKDILNNSVQDSIEKTIENFQEKTFLECFFNKKSPLLNNKNKPKI